MTARYTPAAPAFWLVLPRIAGYPFRGVAAIMLGAMVVLEFLSGMPVLGWAIALFAKVLAFKYVLEIVRDTADGHLDPPEFGSDINSGLALALILVQLMALALIIFASIYLGTAMAWLTTLLLALALPAVLMSLAIDGQVLPALNPLNWLALAARLGTPYFVAAVTSALTLVLGSLAAAMLTATLPAPWGSLIAAASFYWALFASAHLLGYLIFQYHQRLGFTPGREQEKAPELPRNRDQTALAAAEALIESGNAAAARTLLAEHIRDRAVAAALHQRYRQLLDRQHHRDALLAHGRNWLHQLLEERDLRQACALAADCLALSDDFQPLLADDLIAVCTFAAQNGKSQLALDALLCLRAGFPRDTRMAQWAVDAAIICGERFGRIDEARALLAGALDAEPSPALRQQIEQVRGQWAGM